MTARGLFVTGTDTGVGKTRVAVALVRACAARGLRVVGMKPVAAGFAPGMTVNDDVAALAAAGNVAAPLADRNPYAFADAVAPHLAAQRAGRAIELGPIRAAYHRLAESAGVVVVEGAGGALVPLDDRTDMLDVAAALRIPVLLVVGVRLGCLNLARMSALAIRARGLELSGWIACRTDPSMALADENVAWLARELPVPLLADLDSAAPLPESALARLRLIGDDRGIRQRDDASAPRR